ncbi:MAG: hypothetical protein ACI39C_01320 [Dietzia sp.]
MLLVIGFVALACLFADAGVLATRAEDVPTARRRGGNRPSPRS